ncbi:RNA ligase family protein [Pedobacter gandavensis]|uniref:RNA ligase family protein n=1 Tax=Pedobacter gandavensis TaxID=2679963 RepID=UPI00247940E8|nr:RNA ligase family protein [Pedobacter gandavensis]WGQ09140.1 RNA ligase family protein [Pedobacter gandavensis]
MAISQKYGRTFHYPFSPGTTSDDRIQHDYWKYLQQIPTLIHTEKLDGENNCLSKYGVFARSHAAPTTSRWTESLRHFWQLVKRDLGELEFFMENLYAIHSIEYRNLEHHFYVFGIRERERWLSWEETVFYASLLDLPTVPVLKIEHKPANQQQFEKEMLALVNGSGTFNPYDVQDEVKTTMEGVVSRNANGYEVNAFAQNVFKYVRKGHVKTNEHWIKNWKRASLINEGGGHVEF